MTLSWVCSTFLIVLGNSGIILGIVEIMKVRARVRNWLTIQGMVAGTRVVGYSYRAGSKGRTVTNYEPMVSYEYQVGETTFRNNRLTFGSSYFSQAKAKKIVESFPNGMKVTVFYDPDNPYESVLDTRSNRGIAYILIGFILLVLGYVFLY